MHDFVEKPDAEWFITGAAYQKNRELSRESREVSHEKYKKEYEENDAKIKEQIAQKQKDILATIAVRTSTRLAELQELQKVQEEQKEHSIHKNDTVDATIPLSSIEDKTSAPAKPPRSTVWEQMDAKKHKRFANAFPVPKNAIDDNDA